MKAKAIIFEGVRKVKIGEIKLPEICENDIVVDVIKSAVSVGTERWALLGLRPEIKYPCIPGYLAVGRIIKTGKNVKGYKEGDLVNFLVSRLPEPFSSNCWMGAHLSKAVINVDISTDEKWGMPYCIKIEDKVDESQLEEIALAGLAAVSCRGIEMAQPSLGNKCLVAGLGFIGQMASQILKLKGCYVVGADIIQERVEIAEKYSCDIAVNVKDANLVEKIGEIEKEFDIIIDTTGSAKILNEEVKLLKQWGKFVWQGWYPDKIPVDFHLFHSKLPTIYMPCGHAGKAVNQCIRWSIEKKLVVAPLITHRENYKKAKEIYQKVIENPSEILGIVFNWEE